jgi:hypothetical protein
MLVDQNMALMIFLMFSATGTIVQSPSVVAESVEVDLNPEPLPLLPETSSDIEGIILKCSAKFSII